MVIYFHKNMFFFRRSQNVWKPRMTDNVLINIVWESYSCHGSQNCDYKLLNLNLACENWHNLMIRHRRQTISFMADSSDCYFAVTLWYSDCVYISNNLSELPPSMTLRSLSLIGTCHRNGFYKHWISLMFRKHGPLLFVILWKLIEAAWPIHASVR